jgi:hypothetical protein
MKSIQATVIEKNSSISAEFVFYDMEEFMKAIAPFTKCLLKEGGRIEIKYID